MVAVVALSGCSTTDKGDPLAVHLHRESALCRLLRSQERIRRTMAADAPPYHDLLDLRWFQVEFCS